MLSQGQDIFFMDHLSLNILRHLLLKHSTNLAADFLFLFNVIMEIELVVLQHIQDVKMYNREHVWIYDQIIMSRIFSLFMAIPLISQLLVFDAKE